MSHHRFSGSDCIALSGAIGGRDASSRCIRQATMVRYGPGCHALARQHGRAPYPDGV